jgi:hypothetical protein
LKISFDLALPPEDEGHEGLPLQKQKNILCESCEERVRIMLKSIA